MCRALVDMAELGRKKIEALHKDGMLLCVRRERLSPRAFLRSTSLCNKSVKHLKTLFRNSGAAHQSNTAGVAALSKGKTIQNVRSMGNFFTSQTLLLIIKSDRAISNIALKLLYSLKEQKGEIQRKIKLKQTNKNHQSLVMLFRCISGRYNKAIRTTGNDKILQIWDSVCSSMLPLLPGDVFRKKTIQPGVQGYRGCWFMLGSCDTNQQRESFLYRVR